MNAARTSKPLAGRWVKTIVRTSPIRSAMRTATRAENADSTPAQKNTVPLTAIDRSKRRCNHRTSIAVITKPPPNESRLNSAANR